jgi:hypothetical protein
MSSSSNPLFPRIDKYRRALTAGNNRTANDSQGPSSEDLEMKRYRELRASNAFHVGTDFYSPRLAEADKMVCFKQQRDV